MVAKIFAFTVLLIISLHGEHVHVHEHHDNNRRVRASVSR